MRACRATTYGSAHGASNIEHVCSRAFVGFVPLVSNASAVLAQSPSTRLRASSATTHAAGHELAGTFIDSLKLLAIEHGLRLGFQQKTRDALDGNFWRDYRRSLRVPE